MTHLTVYAKAAKPMITQMFTRVLLMRPFCPSRVAPVTSPSLLLLFCDAVSCPSLISPLSLIFSWISCEVGHEHQIENMQQVFTYWGKAPHKFFLLQITLNEQKFRVVSSHSFLANDAAPT